MEKIRLFYVETKREVWIMSAFTSIGALELAAKDGLDLIAKVEIQAGKELPGNAIQILKYYRKNEK